MDEVRIGNAEQRLDAFGLEQVEDALVNRGTAGLQLEVGCRRRRLRVVIAHYVSLGLPAP